MLSGSRKPLLLMFVVTGLLLTMATYMLHLMEGSHLTGKTLLLFNKMEASDQVKKLTEQSMATTKNCLSSNKPYDKPDDSGAKAFLELYKQKFSKFSKGDGNVNPNIPSTIKTWWQAAAMIDWYINSPLRHTCHNITNMGNWHICQDEPYTIKPPCLVYSFGIAWDFSFDDEMGRLGCEVHSFDPSMGEKDHKRNKNVTFHNMGLAAINSDGYIARRDMYVRGTKLWKVRTVKHIKNMLGHQNRTIDVFKMDVEGYEWAVIDNMMETGMFDSIRQYMLEYHLFQDQPARQDIVFSYNIARRLRELGMREFRVSPHPKTIDANNFNNQGDNEYVNAKFHGR